MDPHRAGHTVTCSCSRPLYNPIRGAFTSVDPVPGGNTTAYTYPQDPVNQMDLDGQSKKSKIKNHFKKHWKKYAFAASFLIPGGAVFAGLRMGLFATRAAKGARIAKLAGKNRVRIVRGKKKPNYDVAGKAHYSKATRKYVKTPHKTFQTRNPRSPSGWGKATKDAKRMTHWDLYRVERAVRKGKYS